MIQCVKSGGLDVYTLTPILHFDRLSQKTLLANIYPIFNSQLREIKRSVYMEHDIQVAHRVILIYFFLLRELLTEMWDLATISSV